MLAETTISNPDGNEHHEDEQPSPQVNTTAICMTHLNVPTPTGSGKSRSLDNLDDAFFFTPTQSSASEESLNGDFPSTRAASPQPTGNNDSRLMPKTHDETPQPNGNIDSCYLPNMHNQTPQPKGHNDSSSLPKKHSEKTNPTIIITNNDTDLV